MELVVLAATTWFICLTRLGFAVVLVLVQSRWTGTYCELPEGACVCV